MKHLTWIVLFFLFSHSVYSQAEKAKISEYTMDLYDESRERTIPLAIYSPKDKSKGVVIMNHGYGRNNPDSYKSYSKITKELASQGFFVISIQHELANDELLAMEENFLETRKPNWQKGVDNILFTIRELKQICPNLDWSNVSLIGHSNGGDMAMLFATEHPEYIKKVISLDHRRMPIPLTNSPKLYSLRGSDFEADKGVIPSKEDQKKYGIKIINFTDIKHGDMDDKGSDSQMQIINSYLIDFLNE